MYINIKTYTIVYILVVAILYVLSSLYIDTEMISTPKLNYKKLLEIADTGDLIIFRWNIIDVGFRLFSKYSHVGMIVKHKNKLYILETHPNENLYSNEKDNSGIHLYSLKPRLLEYEGTYYFTKLKSTCSRQNLKNHILQNLKKYKKDIPFDNNFRNTFVFNYIYNLLNIKVSNRKEMFCSEFIATILENCKIYKHSKNLSSINPGTFLEFTKNNKQLYDSLYHIYF
jgi:hypothetical protein